MADAIQVREKSGMGFVEVPKEANVDDEVNLADKNVELSDPNGPRIAVKDMLEKKIVDDYRSASKAARSPSNDSGNGEGNGSLVLNDNDISSLKALVKSDFDMPVKDRDFKLTHEQLIKATKILLYKINLINKKNKYRQEQTLSTLQNQYKDIDQKVQS